MPMNEVESVEILALIDSLGQGGAERSLIELATAMRPHGVQTTIATLTGAPSGFRSEAERAGIDLIEVSAPKRVGQARQLRRLLKSGRFSLLHTTLFWSDVIGRVAAWRTDVPVLTSIVNTSYSEQRLNDPRVRPNRLKAARLLDRATARHLTEHFHVISETVAASAVKTLGVPRSAMTLVPRGREATRLEAGKGSDRMFTRSDLGIGASRFVFVTVGRNEFQKGQDLLIPAMRIVVDAHYDTHLLIVGRAGNETDDLNHLVDRFELSEHILLTGYRSDVPALLAASDAFVFPSRFEGLGGALIEAMAIGIPIIASDIPAIGETVGDAGVLVPLDDVQSLASAMITIIEDADLRKRLAVFGTERVESQFAFEVVVTKMATLFKSVAAARKR
jgi:glycosyltransferase involved in cell wall biosynthesis